MRIGQDAVPVRAVPSRRAVIGGAAAAICSTGQGLAAAPAPPRTASIRWAGAGGRTLHGYMAIPAKAHGRQPAVLVIGEARALPPIPDPSARLAVDRLGQAGLLACTADNLTSLEDLRASLAWLRLNRYATGKVALAGIGSGGDLAGRIAELEGDAVQAVLLLGSTARAPSTTPSLTVLWSGDGPVPADAVAFLRRHIGSKA